MPGPRRVEKEEGKKERVSNFTASTKKKRTSGRGEARGEQVTTRRICMKKEQEKDKTCSRVKEL